MTTGAKQLPLLMFAPCERVVIGAEGDNSSSLIAILQGFKVNESEIPTVPEQDRDKAPVPLIPQPWYVFALWENDFSGRSFRQRFELRSPRKRVVASGESDLSLRDKRFHRVSGRVPGFPIDGMGDYQLVLLLKTDDGEYVERQTFPIPVGQLAVDE